MTILGGILVGGSKVMIRGSKKIASQIFSNPGNNDVTRTVTGDAAKGLLTQFGKFAKGIVLNPKDVYTYTNAHGAAELFNESTGENVIQAVARLSGTGLLKAITKRF